MEDIEQVRKYLSKYRELLHAYNETKDTAILLLSKVSRFPKSHTKNAPKQLTSDYCLQTHR
jgi:hypothetical protein